MKIEKLGLTKDGFNKLQTILVYYLDCENKINELIDQVNTNTKILTKFINDRNARIKSKKIFQDKLEPFYEKSPLKE